MRRPTSRMHRPLPLASVQRVLTRSGHPGKKSSARRTRVRCSARVLSRESQLTYPLAAPAPSAIFVAGACYFAAYCAQR